ncbi:MAG: metallophosphoesterase [Armatimonadota bacterium]|nr:MAG: metallophosphoesterase [Armatimonadota bacterium]
MRLRSALLLVLLSCAAPCAARDASGKLDKLVLPNECRPALAMPGDSFQVLVRDGEINAEVTVILSGRDARAALDLRATGRREPDGAAWFRATVPADLLPGAYSLTVQLGAQSDTNPRSVFVVEGFPTDYTVAQLTDTHIGSGRFPAAETLRSLAAEVNREKPFLILITGDVTDHGEPNEYQAFVELLSCFDAPTVVCAGNHDRNRPTLDSAFLEYCGDANYFFNVGSDRFVACDTEFRWTDWQRDPQWLAVVHALRGEPSTRWRVLFTHRYEPGMSHHLQRYLYGNRLLAYVAGHWHHDFVGEFPGGTKWIATAPSVAGCWRMFDIGPQGIAIGPLRRTTGG